MKRKRSGASRGWAIVPVLTAVCLLSRGAWLGALRAVWTGSGLGEKAMEFQLGDTGEDSGAAVLAGSPFLWASVPEGDEEAMEAEELALLEETPAEEARPEPPVQTEEIAPEEIPPSEPDTAALAQVSITDRAGAGLDAEEAAQTAWSVTLAQEGPQILLMHTHTTEAYTPEGEDQYEASDPYRTTDGAYSVVRVGDEIAQRLEARGYRVLHDTTLYDYPGYNGSYARSRAGIQAILEENPTIGLVLDIHRDALIGEDGTAYKVLTEVDGEDTAQVMLVVGTDLGGLSHPDWRDNLSFGVALQRHLLGMESSFARPLNLRASRFNQDLTPCSLLVEVGSCGNTLQEALRAADRFAEALADTLSEQGNNDG